MYLGGDRTGYEAEKWYRVKGLQGPTGTWVADQRRQGIECITGGGGWRDGSLFGQSVQDRNEGGKSGVESGAAQSQGGGWEGGVGACRVKGTDPENRRTVGRGFKIRR